MKTTGACQLNITSLTDLNKKIIFELGKCRNTSVCTSKISAFTSYKVHKYWYQNITKSKYFCSVMSLQNNILQIIFME